MNTHQIISLIKTSLKDMAFLDIQRASDGGSKMGAFILGSCFIEYLAGFRYGKKTTRDDFKRFVREYMSSEYDAEKLYHDLRCQLVHNYSEGGSYVFIHANDAWHGRVSDDGRIVINLENFIEALGTAMARYFDQIDHDTDLLDLAIKRYKALGLLTIKLLPDPSTEG